MTTAPNPASPSAPDDLSTYLHRQCIGCLGALLPILVWLIAGLRPAGEVANRWRLLDSISSYFYTSGVLAFVGVLAALAVFLLTYRGYDNAFGAQDRLTAWLAGWAAAIVASFPTRAAPDQIPGWWRPWIGNTHYAAATLLFSCFMFFSLVLFTKSGGGSVSRSKRARNVVYRVCGVGIGVCLVWILVASLSRRSIFWAEAVALELFAFSWLTKGRAELTAVRLASWTAHYGRHPRQLVGDLHRRMASLSGKPPADRPLR